MFRMTTAALLFASFAGATFSLPAAAQSTRVYGVDIVPWSKKIGDGRFKSGRDFDKTIKFFADNFRGSSRVKWLAETNLPRVKYRHLQNLSTSRVWDGINIYEIKGTVYIYVLPHVDAPAEAKAGDQGATLLPRGATLKAQFADAQEVPLDDILALLR